MVRMLLVGAVLAAAAGAAGTGCKRGGATERDDRDTAPVAQAGKVTAVAGAVTVTPAAGGAARPLEVGDVLASNDTVITGADGVVDVVLARNGALLHLGVGQSVRIDDSLAWSMPQQTGAGDLVATDPTQSGVAAAGKPAENSAARATVGAVPAPEQSEPHAAVAAPDTNTPVAANAPVAAAPRQALTMPTTTTPTTPTTPTAAPPPPPPPPPPTAQPAPPVQPQPIAQPRAQLTPTPPPQKDVGHRAAPPAAKAPTRGLSDVDIAERPASPGAATAGPSGDDGGGDRKEAKKAADDGPQPLPASADLIAKLGACFPAGSKWTIVVQIDAQGHVTGVKHGGANASGGQTKCARDAMAAGELSLASGTYKLTLR